MSDRRPEKLYVSEGCKQHGEVEPHDVDPSEGFQNDVCWARSARFTEASPADLIAELRRGVESGTIEGISVELVSDGLGIVASDQRLVGACYDEGPYWHLEPGIYIVIGPVSDGGSET